MTSTWFFREEEVMQYDLVARANPSFISRLGESVWPGFVADLPADDLLDLADWIIHKNNRGIANDLEAILESGGSVWTVATRNGQSGLARRMTESVQVASEAALQKGPAGRILGEAWVAAYGRVPDPEEAYEKAIKAVEEAVVEIVSPKNKGATLGSIVRDMKAQKDWGLGLPGRERDVVVSMAEALWTGQESRHGGNGYRRPSQAEGETAVTLGVALVQLFTSGSVTRLASTV